VFHWIDRFHYTAYGFFTEDYKRRAISTNKKPRSARLSLLKKPRFLCHLRDGAGITYVCVRSNPRRAWFRETEAF